MTKIWNFRGFGFCGVAGDVLLFFGVFFVVLKGELTHWVGWFSPEK